MDRPLLTRGPVLSRTSALLKGSRRGFPGVPVCWAGTAHRWDVYEARLGSWPEPACTPDFREAGSKSTGVDLGVASGDS